MRTEGKTLGIIGCGNMGSALVENLKKKAAFGDIFVFDIDKGKKESLVKGFRVNGCDTFGDLVSKSDVIVVAVKPQDIDTVFKELKGVPGKLVISIAAGITLRFMEASLGKSAALVRAMPNINALVGQSVTALCANQAAGSEGLDLARKIFEAVGKVVLVQDSQMNAVTAISGSGPAFVAYLINELGEAALERVMIRESEYFKIEPATAAILARETIAGTNKNLAVNFDAPILIKRVCSKGGTTEAGMRVFEEKGKTEKALSEAIRAAEKRAAELARGE